LIFIFLIKIKVIWKPRLSCADFLKFFNKPTKRTQKRVLENQTIFADIFALGSKRSAFDLNTLVHMIFFH